MKIFTIFGDVLYKLFDIIGMVILEIPRIPDRLRGIDTDNIREKIDRESLKENISKIKNDERIKDGVSKISDIRINEVVSNKGNLESDEVNAENVIFSEEFTSQEKERAVFLLQIVSGSFLVLSMLFIFNFISFFIYGVLGIAAIAYVLYALFSKIKVMYVSDFNAYRDFFLMYIAVGIIMVFVGTNPNFVLSFSFEFLPSLSILIFAFIAVVGVFLIFRIRYHRDFTYGHVIETGKKTAYVKVDYDIRCNVKPDIYLVDNSYGADDGDNVKVKIDEKLFTMGGNKPVSIIDVLK
ncbi:MAG TPA: DUF2101 family protein [Methanobacterium sp.]|nr:DUF2101 family protein [Methanobacterium sp.]